MEVQAMRRHPASFVCSCILLLLASIVPVSDAVPTEHGLIPMATPQDIGIESNVEWGIVPFDVVLRVASGWGPRSVRAVHWDFDGDGAVDASGLGVSHRLSEPVDHTIRASIVTRGAGTLVLEITIPGHTALMSLVFDDGHDTVFDNALNILRTRNVTATAYIVPTWIDNVNYMTWEEVDSLQAAGWDIGSHGYNHLKLPELDDSLLHYELTESKLELERRGFPARHLALPHNAGDDRVIAAAKLYYESCRGGGGLNPCVEMTYPYRLASHCAFGSKSFEYYQAHIDSAIAAGGWYILNNHKTHRVCQARLFCINVDVLEAVIDYAIERRVRIANIDEALGYREKMIFPEELLPTFSEVSISPNPFASEAAVTYALWGSGRVCVSAYDVRGRLVNTLYEGAADKERRSSTWNGTNDRGVKVAPGVYFIKLETGADTVTRPVILLR
jgi:peptidoglycan/xylan/chitin deacetylase (PgdA/CDA1 family)